MDIRNGLKLAENIKANKISSLEITKLMIEKIKNDSLGAILSVNEENALKEALESENKESILKGVPVLLKDNILNYGCKTTAASKMLENYIAPYDATVVKKLKSAGMPILGNANMDEFAMGSSNENSYFKNVKNYHDNERVPGGSSGGSATAVAAAYVPFALGTDTGGSIRQPASLSGVVGIKPTYSRVSRYGLIAFSSSLDQIGVFANNSCDAAALLQIIAGYDPLDATSSKVEVPNYLETINNDIKDLVIGIPREYFTSDLNYEMRNKIFEVIEKLKNIGVKFKEVSLKHTKYAISSYYIISSAEASSNLARLDGIRYGYRSENSKDINSLYLNTRTEGFGKEVKRRIMIGNYVLSSGFFDEYYTKASKIRRLITNDFKNAFEEVDLIIAPTSPTTAFKIGEKESDPVNMYLSDVYTVSVNLVGLPAISVPCGKINNLPVGVQFIGNYFDEALLFNVANIYEKIRGEYYE